MGFKLHLNDIEDIVYESGEKEYKVDASGTQELRFNYNYRNLKGQYTELILPNFKIGFGKNTLHKKTTLFFEFDEECVEMHFTLQGASNTTINKMMNPYTINNNTHNIFYCNDIKGKVEMFSKEMNILEINLHPSFFEQYLPCDEVFEKFKKIINNKEIGFLSNSDYPITTQMHLVIQEIINCSYVNEYRQLFLDAKVLELLLLQIQQISTYNICTTYQTTSKSIVDKMHNTREIILQELNNPLTLLDIALKVNTNKGTLKKEFKNVFGTTVFGYIKDLKMEKAKSMLLNQKITIGEVSDKIGYKNPQHFSTAFKKKFGVPPSEFLKKH